MSALISCLLIATVVTMCSSCVDNVYKEKDLDGTLVPDEGYEGWDYCGFYINNVIDTKMSTTAKVDSIRMFLLITGNQTSGIFIVYN